MAIHVIRESLTVSIVPTKLDRSAVLSVSDGVSFQSTALPSEINLDTELAGCVYLVGGWAVAVVPSEVFEVIAASIAAPVVTLVCWCVALVSRGLPRVHVCLHDVEFGAESAANLVCIAVVVVLAAKHIVAILIFAWHADLVESSDAATLLATEIDIVGD